MNQDTSIIRQHYSHREEEEDRADWMLRKAASSFSLPSSDRLAQTPYLSDL